MSLALLCDCEYSEESNILGSMCNHCKKREGIESTKPWYIEIKTIKKYYYQMDVNSDINKRISIIQNLIEYIITRPSFMAANPNFRKAITNKMIEFSQHESGEKLKDVFQKMNLFIESLANHADYKS